MVKKIPTESQIKRMKELEDIKEEYLKQFKNPIVRGVMGVIRWHKVEGLVILLVIALTAIVLLTVSYNKKDGISIKPIETKVNIEKKM